MELIRFIFSSVWIYMGTVLLIIVSGITLSDVIKAIISHDKVSKELLQDIHKLYSSNLNVKVNDDDITYTYKGTIPNSNTETGMPMIHEVGDVYTPPEHGEYLGFMLDPDDAIVCVHSGDKDCLSDWLIKSKKVEE